MSAEATISRPAGGRRPFFRRRKTCPFTGPNAPVIDYKDVKLLQRFTSERGKIVPMPRTTRRSVGGRLATASTCTRPYEAGRSSAHLDRFGGSSPNPLFCDGAY